MKQSSQTRPSLPPEWAFVIQFSGTDVEHGHVEGRVEHVQSGEATRFESLDTLVEFFARVLSGPVEGARRASRGDHVDEEL